MVRKRTLLAGALGSALAVAAAGTLYLRYETETVPYTTVAKVGDVELRRYPPALLAETVAPDSGEAFQRLFGYISGDNDDDARVSMTAPVEVDTVGASIPMTAPVELGSVTESEDDASVRMAFYLPAGYDYESAPTPTDEDVHLVAVPARTLAVRRFSWRATDDRVARETAKLRSTLDSADVGTVGEPWFQGYDAPWTLPVLRRNEVAIEVRDGGR